MSAHMTQATPTPTTQTMPSPITVLPILATTTAPVPLPPNPSSCVATAATPPTSNTSYTFPPDLEVTPPPKASWTIKQGPKALIGKITCPEVAAAVQVSAPVTAKCLREKLPLPWHFLVSNIPQNLADFLEQQVVVFTLEVTCFFSPFNLPLQTYLCTLENFALPCTAKANTIVTDLVKSTLLSDHKAVSFIEKRMKHPIPGAVEKAIHSIYTQNFSITLSSTKKKTLWNMYCHCPPELSLSDFLTWVNKIHSTEFISEDYGRGTACTGEKQFSCFGCKSLDHPAGLCPFTELPGWFGPTTKSAESNECDMIERDHGSPNRHAQ
ncbi:hypothetical protein J3A83DRAFT_4383155 [Scleroderma citrinum]